MDPSLVNIMAPKVMDITHLLQTATMQLLLVAK